MERITQIADGVGDLRKLVDALAYKPFYEFELIEQYDRGQGSVGTTLVITITTANSYNEGQMRRVAHLFPVPPAAYVRSSWQRWLLDRILDVEQHEACEYFRIHVDEDGNLAGHASGYAQHPYAPNHGPGHDPYTIRELTTEEDRRTAYTGALNPE